MKRGKTGRGYTDQSIILTHGDDRSRRPWNSALPACVRQRDQEFEISVSEKQEGIQQVCSVVIAIYFVPAFYIVTSR